MIFSDPRTIAFLFGAIGGFAVNVLRWFLLANIPKEERPDFDLLYWAQFFGLALLGGALALAEDIEKQISPVVALNVGLSIPALAKAVASELQGTAKRRRKTN